MIRKETPVNDTFQSPVLTDACGFPVTVSFTGTIRNLIFPNRAVGPQEIDIGNVVWVAEAGNKTVRFQNVGMEMLLVEPDGGTEIRIKAGHHPPVLGEITGVVKINSETGDLTQQSHDVSEATRRRICQQLKPG
jgi:hypothetical protein